MKETGMQKIIKLLSGFIFIFLLISVIAILFQNRNLKHELTRKQNQRMELKRKNIAYENYIHSTVGAQRYVGKIFPKQYVTDIWNQAVSTDFSNKKGAIIIFFDTNSCQPCFLTELKFLNYLFENLKDQLDYPIYAISKNSSSILKKYALSNHLKYPFISDHTGDIIKPELAERTPVVFVINSRNEIVRCHLPVKSYPNFSALFYHEIFNSLNLDGQLFNLKGILITDVVTKNFTDSSMLKFYY